MTASVTFDTTVTAIGNNTGIEVPADLIEKLGAGKRPAVVVSVNGYEYRVAVGVMGGRHLISVSAAIRKETGLAAGAPVHVVLTVVETPLEGSGPVDFDAARAAAPAAAAFFGKLSSSLQRYHVDNVTGAKTAQTRQRRIGKAVSLFLEGKQR